MSIAARRRNRREWDDMSDYVVHFTKRTREGHSHEHMVSMLSTHTIEARQRWGAGRHYDLCKTSVCLSEVPVHQLRRIQAKRGSYGFGFKKDYIRRIGGGPLFYTYGATFTAISTMMRASEGDENAPVWAIAPFVDVITPNYQFEWEREWRVPGNIDFGPDDVSFMLFPEGEHKGFSDYRIRMHEEGRMPLYECPLIDHGWDKERIREILM